MDDCIFCKIVGGKIPAPFVLEDDSTVVIRDLHPQAKHHFLVIPKKHVRSLAELFANDVDGRTVVGNLYSAANRLVQKEGILASGFRAVINTGGDGGQSVFHLHLHILGGEKLSGEFA
jgi:histidine triad (HIT) family protein